MAVDGSGNVFIADEGNNRLVEVPVDGVGYGTQNTINSIPALSSSILPSGVALDAAGNVYVVDHNTGEVLKIARTSTGYGVATTIGTSFYDAISVAVDGSGDVYVSERGASSVVKIPWTGSGYGTQTAVSAGLNGPADMAIDSKGNLFVSNSYGFNIVEEPWTGNSYGPPVVVAAGLVNPSGIAVDANGNLYVYTSDFGVGSVAKVGWNGTGYGSPETLIAGLGAGGALTVDGNGTVYAADPINNTVMVLKRSSPPTISFATPTAVGSMDTTDGPQAVTIDNIGNSPSIIYAPIGSGANPNISNSSFQLNDSGSSACPELTPYSSANGTIPTGSSCMLSLNFEPTSIGSVNGSLMLSVGDANGGAAVETIALSGVGVSSSTGVKLSTPSLSFASGIVGTTSAAQTLTLTNLGQGSLALAIAASGDFAETNNCGVSLLAGGVCTISVTFTPTAAGTRTGTILVTDNATGSPQTVTLSGTGTAATPGIMLAPSALTFASATVGTTSTAQTLTLSNPGTGALAVTSIAASGDFGQTNTCGASVAAGTNCTVSVTFTTTATGTRTGAITITDNATGSPQSVTLTGTGTTAVVTAPVVTLSTSSLTFASETDGTTSAAQTVMLTNSGTLPSPSLRLQRPAISRRLPLAARA